jgi:hypothetical protein
MKTGRQKKSRKTNKAKTSNKKRSTKKRSVSFSVKKHKRGKDIFRVDFPKGAKTENKLNDYFEKINWKLKKFPDDQVKVTFYAKHGKEIGGMTYIYDLPKSGNHVQNLDELKGIFKEMSQDIFRTKGKVKQFAGYLKEARIKDFINRVVIDFESSK